MNPPTHEEVMYYELKNAECFNNVYSLDTIKNVWNMPLSELAYSPNDFIKSEWTVHIKIDPSLDYCISFSFYK